MDTEEHLDLQDLKSEKRHILLLNLNHVLTHRIHNVNNCVFFRTTASDDISLYEGFGSGQFGSGGDHHGDGRRIWSVLMEDDFKCCITVQQMLIHDHNFLMLKVCIMLK